MADIINQIFTPLSFSDLFSTWARYPQACIFAGGTELLCGQGGRSFTLEANTITLNNIDELKRVSRTERYLEIGAAATLSDILSLGKSLPPIMREAIAGIANPQVRSLATLGGNICSKKRFMDAFAPLVALDARLELRSSTSSRWVSIARYTPAYGASSPGEAAELLTRIRIPLENWDYARYQRLGRERWMDLDGASFAFLARYQKNVISDIRIVLAGKTLVRDRDIDNSLFAKTIPIDRRDIQVVLDRWNARCEQLEFGEGLLRSRFFNLIEYCLSDLSDQG